MGNNGIISRSRNATQEYNKASQNEEIGLNEAEKMIENESGASKSKEIAYIDDNIPLPPGFTHEDGSKDTGLVIKDDVGNEWVWIPVDDPSDMFIEDGVSAGNHAGKLYYGTNYGISFDIGLTGQTYTKDIGQREPDIVNSYDLTHIDPIAIGMTNTLLQAEFNNMKTSIEKYKGFYVGRYETGDLSSSKVKAVVQKGNTDISNQTWYNIYKKGKELYESNSKINSSMIWGCQWDHIMIWMKDIPNKTNPSNKYILDSTDMGNYTGTILPTGSSEQYNRKNICDMAGNVTEWTMEASLDTRYRAGRRWILLTG